MRSALHPLSIAVLLLFAMGAQAGSINIPGVDSGSVNVGVKSLKERQFSSIVRQKLDFSCGSAALSTLLTHHYGDPINEETIFKSMWDAGDEAKIRSQGFSLLDIKSFLEKRGYSADGYTTTLDKLAHVGIPAIVLIKDGLYNHFVVIKGVKDGNVAFGDPSLGARVMPQQEFKKMLINRIVFVINGRNDQAVFNNPRDWHVREKAPTNLANGANDLATTMLLRRPVGDF